MTDSGIVSRLPKVELHVHIEGTLTSSMRWRLAQKNGIPLKYKTEDELEESYKTMYNHRKKLNGDNGLPVFLDMYYGGMEVLITEDDFFELAMAYFEKAASMKVRYAEPFFDIQAHTRRGIAVETVMKGLHRAKLEAAERLNVNSNWTMCILRDMSPESAMENYLLALPYRDVYRAIGLDSDEYDRPPSLFEDVFRRAREDGFKITSHCDVGQKDTHEHIRMVATCMGGSGADRIDHGLNAADRPELMEIIKARGLGMTLCPHAYNRRLPAEEVFPKIRKLFDFGIKVTINSDDPTYMHNRWVSENLELTQKHCKFSGEEMMQLQRNAIDISWADPAVKEKFVVELSKCIDNDDLP